MTIFMKEINYYSVIRLVTLLKSQTENFRTSDFGENFIGFLSGCLHIVICEDYHK